MANQPIKMDAGNKVLLLIGSVALVVTVIYLVVQLASFLDRASLEEPGEVEQERIAERIAPIGRVTSGPLDAVEEAADLSPSEVYSNTCAACHDTGASDAPIKGDTDAWAARLEDKGLEALFENSISGIGAMPARGGNPNLSDEELNKVVAYMLDESDVDHGWEGENGNGNGDTDGNGNGDANGTDEAAATDTDDESAAEADAASEDDAGTVAGIALAEGDLGRGESRYPTCVACHGAQGQGVPPAFPKIAGQTAEYIADKLVRYRAGETVGDQTMLMAPNARNLSDQEIADLAVYIAGFEP